MLIVTGSGRAAFRIVHPITRACPVRAPQASPLAAQLIGTLSPVTTQPAGS